MATDAIRAMILGGELRPGDRLIESRLTDQLGVSRPPIREALKDLHHAGLVAQHPRRGMVVRELTQHDVYELITLRDDLEAMTLRLALPIVDLSIMAPVRAALTDLEQAGSDERGGATLVELGFAFHEAVVALANHQRLLDTYRGLQLQLQLCMSLNVASRTQETPAGNAARHHRLVEVLEAGDLDAALDAFASHGHRSFLSAVDQLSGGTPASDAWFARIRGTDVD